jgi:protein SHQ1
MITPRFSCSQDDRSVVVSAYCPAVRASEIEIHVENTLLSLHVAPYFLRLNFPASVVEDDQSSAVYDPASGYLTLTLTKLKRGENFTDLDLLGKLLAPPAQCKPRNTIIEVLDSQGSSGQPVSVDTGTAERDEILKGEHCILTHYVVFFFLYLLYDLLVSDNVAAANEWALPQTVSDTLPALETSLQKPYGFLNAYTGYFVHLGTTENEINELGPDAETLSPSERRGRRLRHEESKWDPEYYMYVSLVPFNIKGTSSLIVAVAVNIIVNTVLFFHQGGLCG